MKCSQSWWGHPLRVLIRINIATINSPKSNAPSIRLSFSSISRTANRITEAMDSGACRRITEALSTMGVTKAETPRTRDRFATLEPTIFPTPSAGLPPHAAIVETTSSGAEVPNPRTMAPTTTELILRDRASCAAESTNISPAFTSMKSPAKSKTAASITSPLMVVSWWSKCAGCVLVLHGGL